MIIIKKIQCYSYTLYLLVLCLIFKFDNWHARSSSKCRKYKNQLITIINDIDEKTCVVEIGCGLGDLLSEIEANNKIGFDLDENVIKAARFINKDISFEQGSFDDVVVLNKNIDVLILVNWIHNIPLDKLIEHIKKITTENAVSYVIVDEVLSSIKGYKYHHDFSDAFQAYETYKVIRDVENIRDFRVLRLRNS